MKNIFLSVFALLSCFLAGAQSLSVPDVSLLPGETANLSVELNNSSREITSVQFDLTLPDGVALNGSPELTSRASSSHSVYANTVGNKYRVVIHSSNSAPFSGSSGAVVSIPVKAAASASPGSYSAALSTIVLATPSGDEINPSNINGSITIKPVVATSVTLNKTELSLNVGQSETLVATVSPDNTTDKTVTWTTSNAAVATVDSNGKVTAIGTGSATITAKCGSVSATCAVTVNPVVATSVTLNKTSLTLSVGQSETLIATVAPDNTTDKTVTWTTSNAAVATVDSNGKVTAVGTGSATITAKCGSVSATCAVTVNPVVATSVTLNKTSLTLSVGQSETLVATVSPDNTTDKTVTWTTSNAAVATVDSNGKVTAVGTGSATITAKCGSVSATCAVSVNPVVATSVTLNKTELSLNVGQSETLIATVAPDNTTDKTVTWTTSNAAVATVDNNGKVTAVGVGSATITAKCGSVSATCSVSVNPVVATSVTLNKTSLTLSVGQSETLVATVSPDNTTDKTVTWTSSNTAVATVDSNGKVTAVGVGSATITAKCGSVSATCAVTVNPVVATSVTLNKTSLTLSVGQSETLIATVAPDNTTDKTITWTSSNTAVATVDSNGKVTAVGTGSATITAKCGSVSATCAVTVNPVVATSVTLNKTSLTLAVGQSETLVATVAPDNTTDKTVTWTTSNAAVATVDSNGKVTAIGTGSATITAKCGSVSATCAVSVNPVVATSVTLNKTSLTLSVGQSETLVATVSPDNTTDKTVTWTTSNAAVATVDSNGKVTAVGTGSATITAKCGSVSATCAVTVNPVVATSVTLNKTSLTLSVGQSETLIATVSPDNTTDKTVTWTSSNTAVATVDSNGKVTAVGVGSATITAKCGSVSATCAVSVNPVVATSVTLNKTSLTLSVGQSETLIATVAPDNTTDKTVTWTTSNAAVATVDSNGKVTAVGTGSATITAKCGSVSATCAVSVNPVVATSVTLNKTELSLNVGQSETLIATVAPDNTTDKTVTWTTSNAAVATVDSNGKVTAVGVGSATITAKCGSVSATCAVTVNPVVATSVTLNKTKLSLNVGQSETLIATVAPDNTTDKTVTWTSSNTSVATVDSNGKVTAVGVGSATITAKCGSVSATCAVTVNPIEATNVILNKSVLNLVVGDSEILFAIVTPENTTDKTITWTSSNPNVATVDNNGKVIAIGLGSAIITATCGSASANCTVNVNPVEAMSITLNLTSLSLIIGDSQTLIATISPENTTDETVTWTSSDNSVATVDNDGKVTAVGVGYAIITATCGHVSASCLVNVSPIVATSITLNTAAITLNIGESQTLIATVEPGNTTDKTVTWTSSNPQVATVDSYGCVTATGVGFATITATCGSVSATCEVTVNPIVATDITLNYTSLTLSIGDSRTLIATVAPDNTTDKTIIWASTNTNVATVDNNGNVTAVGVGFAVITAKCGSVSATCSVSVNPIEAASVTLNKTSLTLAVGQSETLVATVVPDNTTDKTVTWTSSNPTVATVDSDGTVTAVSSGSATITASCGSASASCEVNVSPIVVTSITLNKTSLILALGDTETLIATVAPDNAPDKTVMWASTNPSVATVDANGTVTAVGFGSTSIIAVCGSVSATCYVEVNPVDATGIVLSTNSLTLSLGETQMLIATVIPDNTTDKTLVWTSSNPSVATVDADGNVTAVGYGSATITVVCGAVSAECEVNVVLVVATSVSLNMTSLTLSVGESETLIATVAPENTTDKSIIWASSNPSVATVDADGTVTAVGIGSSTIIAVCGSVSATCSVSVNGIAATSISLNYSSLTLSKGQTETLVATVGPEDASDKTVSWTSSNPSVATVDNTGMVTAIDNGTAVITASCGSVSAECSVEVSEVVATSIVLDKTKLSLIVGDTETLIATVLPENAIDKTVTWRSSAPEVATVDADGNVTAIDMGNVTITASCGDVRAICEVEVSHIYPTSITLSTYNMTLAVGETETLVVTIEPENATYRKLQWRSSDSSIATIDADGTVTAISPGLVNISLICGQLFTGCDVKVINSTMDIVDDVAYAPHTDYNSVDITYTREFADTQWQTLYLPFNMSYAEWSPYAEIAQLSGVKEYDTNDDGVIDDVVIEFARMHEGSELTPHVPYLIRALAPGTFTFEGRNKTVASYPMEDGSAACSGSNYLYTLYGSYEYKGNLDQLGAYLLSDDYLFKACLYYDLLKPFRACLRITSDGENLSEDERPERVRASVDGESFIPSVIMDYPDDRIYDLTGREVKNPRSGVYIKNGQKCYIK